LHLRAGLFAIKEQEMIFAIVKPVSPCSSLDLVKNGTSIRYFARPLKLQTMFF